MLNAPCSSLLFLRGLKLSVAGSHDNPVPGVNEDNPAGSRMR